MNGKTIRYSKEEQKVCDIVHQMAEKSEQSISDRIARNVKEIKFKKENYNLGREWAFSNRLLEEATIEQQNDIGFLKGYESGIRMINAGIPNSNENEQNETIESSGKKR